MKMKRFISHALFTVAALATAGLLGTTVSQAATDYPAGKPITILVPYSAGGTTDATARFLAKGLEKELGTSIQIVNKPGAASQIAHTTLLQAKPDGYTLSYSVLPTVATHYLDPDRKAPYTRTDFRPVAWHWVTPQVIAVKVDSRFKTLKDLVEEARANPGTVTLSTSGLLGTPHLTVLLLEQAAGVNFATVHFKGGAPSVTALLGGHVTAVAGGVSDAVARVRSGEFRVLGIADEEPSSFLPDVPTMKSQGYDVVSVSGGGVIAPAGTPMEIVNKLSAAIKKVVLSEEHRKDLDSYGGIAVKYRTPEEYGQFWMDTEKRLGPVLKTLRASQ